jgi:threonine synthase
VYYFHAVAEVARQIAGRLGPQIPAPITVCTPSGNFGNLTAGLMAKRAGLPVTRFVAATNVNDVVPEYLESGRFTPRASQPTIANAMDVGDPSNFERMLWLYHNDLEAMRQDIVGRRHTDHEIRETIKRVYENRGYLLDPHSAVAYVGLKAAGRGPREVGIFLATAHPAKFSEIVEPVIGRPVDVPPPLAEAVARPRQILRLAPSFEAVAGALEA